MDKKEILQDLRSQFGNVSVLYADQIAELLGKTASGIYGLIARDGLPVPVLEVGGRLAVSIYAIADWLAAGGQAKVEKPPKSGVPAVPAPKRKLEKMEAFLRGVRTQRDFLSELDAELERAIVRESTKPAEISNIDLGKTTP